MPELNITTIKCCNITMNQTIYYRYHVCVITCRKCDKHRDIYVPEYIPYKQYGKYIEKKYLELTRKDEILLNHIVKEINLNITKNQK